MLQKRLAAICSEFSYIDTTLSLQRRRADLPENKKAPTFVEAPSLFARVYLLKYSLSNSRPSCTTKIMRATGGIIRINFMKTLSYLSFIAKAATVLRITKMMAIRMKINPLMLLFLKVTHCLLLIFVLQDAQLQAMQQCYL